MCREVSIYYSNCTHVHIIKLTGWCRERQLRRRPSEPCELKHGFVAVTQCHKCASVQTNWYVDQMREKLAEYWTAASQLGRGHRIHARERFKACRDAVLHLCRVFEEFVDEHNEDCPLAFDRWLADDFRRDPLADGRPVRQPVLPLLVFPDLQMWLDQVQQRARASLVPRSLGDPDSGAEDGDEVDRYSHLLYGRFDLGDDHPRDRRGGRGLDDDE
ncbi:MAG: hypothetical protein M1826_002027 [Phylliscum demangeonii]|nr:MAG: hypothetical protein M1826_002027 [Phylliscum demangeonii]